MGGQAELKGPDLKTEGLAAADLAVGAMLEGHVGEDAVLVVRTAEGLRAIGAHCTHYSAPLVDGLIVGETVRCPWHHACFDLKSGEPVRAPALNPVTAFDVEERDGRIFVNGKSATPTKRRLEMAAPPKRVVVLGAGAAGACAVETLRREGFEGDVTLVGRDESTPVDRPNLSKDYLAGTAPEEWIPLRSPEFYADLGVTLRLGSAARAIDPKAKTVTLEDGSALGFDALIVATGADPVKIPIPGADLPHVHTLRSLADSRAIIERATKSKRAVVIGASFIGLEVAASLRARGLDVTVVAPDKQPLARVLGDDVGAFVRALHEEKGVRFLLEKKPASITETAVTLDDGQALECDLVVMGVGVKPAVAIAESAGIAVAKEGGIATNAFLETNIAGVYAAGDVARYDAGAGKTLRVEHWVHAERQGQVAARNVLGKHEAFAFIPFFWSAHYDVTLAYVGHADSWDRIRTSGSLAARDAILGYEKNGAIVAVLTVGRDRASLLAEVALEKGDHAALEALFA